MNAADLFRKDQKDATSEQDEQMTYSMKTSPWFNGYRRWKWTRRHEFKSWTRLIAFHIALIPLGKV